MRPEIPKEDFQKVDGWFYNRIGALLGSPELKSPKQIRAFGIKSMLLGVFLSPLVYLSFFIATKSGLVKDSNNPLGYPVAFLGMLSPYVFFVGLDCLISGRIWKKDEKPILLSTLNTLGVLTMIISMAVSLGYISYYKMVYAPWKARKLATAKEFEKFYKNFETEMNKIPEPTSDAKISVNKGKGQYSTKPKKTVPSYEGKYKKDPFWDMVKKDERARERNMQTGPIVCGALWFMCFGIFAIYFVMLGTMKTNQ